MHEPSLDSTPAVPEPYPLRVAYDAHSFVTTDGGTGKGAQLRNLLAGFRSSFVGLAPPPRNASTDVDTAALGLIRQGSSRYLLWQQTSLPRLLDTLQPDVFLAPSNTAPLLLPRRTKLITVVHDLILLEKALPGTPLKQRLINLYRSGLMRRAMQRSSQLLTVSQFTADQIRKRYPRMDSLVIPCSISHSWYVRAAALPASTRDPYILIVSNFHPHKNLGGALRAFAQYRTLDPQSRLKLRMVGVSRDQARVHALMNELRLPADSILIEPFLSETDLQHLYRRAWCVLFPSFKEGFGIPLLESMASGTPILSSNTCSLPEVGDDAPIYFDPARVEEIAQALLRVCSSSDLRQTLIHRGLARAEVFHPDRVHAAVRHFWLGLSAKISMK